ncbi:hypothetical protein P9112_007662 [Eukaryota sp. TZLM1-RC]
MFSVPPNRQPFVKEAAVYDTLFVLSSRPSWPFPPLRSLSRRTGGRGVRPWCYLSFVSATARRFAEAHRRLLTDEPVCWKQNFFTTCSHCLGCPAPKTYASSVLRWATFSPRVAAFANEWLEFTKARCETLLDISGDIPDVITNVPLSVSS